MITYLQKKLASL